MAYDLLFIAGFTLILEWLGISRLTKRLIA
jgi:hypothetical protein